MSPLRSVKKILHKVNKLRLVTEAAINICFTENLENFTGKNFWWSSVLIATLSCTEYFPEVFPGYPGPFFLRTTADGDFDLVICII